MSYEEEDTCHRLRLSTTGFVFERRKQVQSAKQAADDLQARVREGRQPHISLNAES
jgi:hypothetical protein